MSEQLEVVAWLERKGAHHDVVEWARGHGSDWATFWQACPRGDWLLGVAARVGVDRRQLVLAAAACARGCLDCVPAGESRLSAAIGAAERWARGEGDLAAVHAARDALAHADFPDPAVASAAAAAHATAEALDDPEAASLAAANAAHADLMSVGDCAMLAALSHAQRAAADAVRRHVPYEAIAQALLDGR
jgi:hypothetical protein